MKDKYPPPYDIIRLNPEPRGWGVISRKTGALVPSDGLTMRLTRDEARRIADQHNADAAIRAGPAGDADAEAKDDGGKISPPNSST